jgi:hypothetical protein
MSLAGVKKKCKKCYQFWFWRLLAFVTDFGIIWPYVFCLPVCFQNISLKMQKNVTRFGFWRLFAFVTDFGVVLAINLDPGKFFCIFFNPCS